jgi:CheY-like chemotaxis protein
LPTSRSREGNKMVKILLVDDSETDRDMLSRRLIKKGFEVIMAVDGKQGVEMAGEHAPDIILLDMSLPVMDGWEAAQHLKSNDATKQIPVIALTAYAMAGDKKKAMEAGCDDYDAKPVDIERLLGKINAWLEK